jgi:pimeloyl-ACP methyl ester carboxylesterase
MTQPMDEVAAARAHAGQIEIGGQPFAYLECGPKTGPLVLCLHGFPDVPRSLLPVLRALGAAGYRAVAPWLRGYAPSTLAGPYGPLPLGSDALTLCATLAPGQRAYLVGHDWGAVAVYVAASLAPNRIAAAVTMSVPHPAAFARALPRHPTQLARSSYMAAFQLPILPDRLLAARGGALIRRLWRLWSPGLRAPAELAAEVAGCIAASLPAPLDHYRALRRPRQLAFLLGQTAGIRVPTLELHGARDGCISAELGAETATYFAAAHERRILVGAGHFVHVEAPAVVASAVVDWLERHPV